MLGAAVSFPYTVDPNAGNYDYTGASPSYPMTSEDLAIYNLPLRSQPLYGDSLQYATDAIKGSQGNYTGIVIAAIAGVVVLKVLRVF